MSEGDRERWNPRHAGAAASEPSPFLLRHVAVLPRDGDALDLACGRGRHSVPLAEHGLRVLAVDVSDVALAAASERALAAGVTIETLRHDLSSGLPPGSWNVIVDTYFLERDLLPAVRAALRPGGWLVFETFTVAHAERTGFPRRYCLEPNELLGAFAGLDVVAHEVTDHVESLLARRAG